MSIGLQVMLEERQRGMIAQRQARIEFELQIGDVLWLRRSAPRSRVTIMAGSTAASGKAALCHTRKQISAKVHSDLTYISHGPISI